MHYTYPFSCSCSLAIISEFLFTLSFVLLPLTTSLVVLTDSGYVSVSQGGLPVPQSLERVWDSLGSTQDHSSVSLLKQVLPLKVAPPPTCNLCLLPHCQLVLFLFV